MVKVEGLKIDCHDCTRVFYVNNDNIGMIEYCPYCLSPDVVAYNEVNIYIGKAIE